MRITYPIPVALFALASLAFLVGAHRARRLKCVLIASYCGVIVTSFTGGASGAVWLAPLFLLLFAPTLLLGSTAPSFGSARVTHLTHALFVIYLIGIVVGLGRYDPNIEILKSGSFTTVMGIPTRILIAGYRTVILASVWLAFMLPLRYRIDRGLLTECLKLCWFFTVILAVLGITDYLNIANMEFSYRRASGYHHVAILGFHRGSLGMMYVTGIFLSYILSQLTSSHTLKALVYSSVPLLILGLLFSWSRAAALAMAAGSVSLVFTLGGSRAAKSLALSFAGLVCVSIALSQFPDLRARFSLAIAGSDVERSAGRIEAWTNLLSFLLHHPDVLAVGVGFQNFHYFVHLSSGAVALEAAHNNYLNILTEAGLFGLALFLFWLGSILTWLRRWRGPTRDPRSPIVPGVCLSLMLAIIASCLTQESLAPGFSMVPFTLHFYLILGMWVSYYRSEMMDRFSEISAANLTHDTTAPVESTVKEH